MRLMDLWGILAHGPQQTVPPLLIFNTTTRSRHCTRPPRREMLIVFHVLLTLLPLLASRLQS